MDDHYATLEVRPTATAQEIERAYRRLARANHPDLLRAAPPEVRQRAEEALKRVNRAHRVLGDRERRRAYDHERARRPAAPRPAPADPRPASPAPSRPPVAERTSHWGAGGPIDIEWAARPARSPRPNTDIFALRNLVWCAIILIILTGVVMLLWNPPPLQPTATPIPIPTP